MKHTLSLITVSEEIQESIDVYGDSYRYMNKKAEFADALGFISNIMVNDEEENRKKWYLVIALLSEYQDTIDNFRKEAKRE